MIEKFLEKFLPQITERLNENEEVGKALIEALAVLDNYATINNVQFTDEQVNTMLGVVPEPAPEPNADIPAEIVEIVEKKKRGRKPKAATTAQPSTWSWRFKTEEELINEYGANYGMIWGAKGRNYLFGKAIPKTAETEEFIKEILNLPKSSGVDANTKELFGIDSGSGEYANNWFFTKPMFTEQPLPTAAASTTWDWRFKTEEEFKEEYGDDWVDKVDWLGDGEMDYLLGQEIAETTESKEAIKELTARTSSKALNTFDVLGITSGGRDLFRINTDMLINKPLPKVILRRGQPLTQPTNTAWTWRFKTEQELQQEWGLNRWKIKVAWNNSGGMDYLLGKPIIESDLSKQFIEDLLKSSAVSVDTNNNLGIDSGSRNIWTISEELVTNKPLPTAAAPVKTEPKKRGRKPKTAWNWRFKTEEEFKEEYGDDWREEANWSVQGGMDYLLGEEIAETSNSRDVISLLKKGINSNTINTQRELGISSGDDDDWLLKIEMLTDEPLPTAAAPKKSEPKKRGRKPKSELPEIDLGGLEDIGDIDIDAIDFDNLVI